MSDVPRSLQSWVSTIHTVVLTADVFQLFIKNRISSSTPVFSLPSLWDGTYPSFPSSSLHFRLQLPPLAYMHTLEIPYRYLACISFSVGAPDGMNKDLPPKLHDIFLCPSPATTRDLFMKEAYNISRRRNSSNWGFISGSPTLKNIHNTSYEALVVRGTVVYQGVVCDGMEGTINEL